MKRFDIGEEVYALTTRPGPCCQPRVAGEKYIVLATQFCVKCGEQSINIAGQTDDFGIIVCECGSEQKDDGLWWTKSEYFTKAEEVDNEIEAAISSEEYEMASILRDIKLKQL